MTVKIDIYDENHNFKNLINDLKNKKPIIIKENEFGINLKLNVNTFDEIICLLEKYSKKIEITLSIYDINTVRLFISKKETYCGLGSQVE